MDLQPKNLSMKFDLTNLVENFVKIKPCKLTFS